MKAKTTGETIFVLEKPEDLSLFLSKAEFSYLPDLDGLTQTGGMVTDIRPILCLLEYGAKKFDGYETIRSKDPNLLEQFNTIVDRLEKIKVRLNTNHKAIQDYNKDKNVVGNK